MTTHPDALGLLGTDPERPEIQPLLPPEFPPPWASAWGDDRWGIWADLEVNGVMQRMRWIPPGEFTMGSGDDDDLAYPDEKPAHRVRLTEGYWLADTACTQSLWLAVMGEANPSGFQDDPAQPVEQVSWDDATEFLKALSNRWTEGVVAELPTEAQWEYACRAGTRTRFHFGHGIQTDWVNFNGQVRLVDEKASWGEPRKRTVPVKSLPANSWGLYEMHGNVWEWCADGVVADGGLRPYPKQQQAEALENPIQPPGEGRSAHRVLRGGSWLDDAQFCLSAYRNAGQRDRPYGRTGFRFALRPSTQSTDEP
ncbi:formylglycine-generating enzyme family protein [Pseudaquabacterium rugosum]|uniref:Formylglycine-generating enzyme family protein n=1 Tax=Pseudaquabacterium rugosum TaxID=2984194 RepID=A0ABU9B7Y8_9BURK